MRACVCVHAGSGVVYPRGGPSGAAGNTASAATLSTLLSVQLGRFLAGQLCRCVFECACV